MRIKASAVEFEYLYRDGSNYKNHGSVVFKNDSRLSTAKIIESIEKNLEDGENFIAYQVGIPEVFLWDPDVDYDPDDENTYPESLGPGGYAIDEGTDHCWHEFAALSVLDAEPTDTRTITEFIRELQRAKNVGWRLFLPIDRRAV